MTQEEIEAMEEQEHFSNVLQSFSYYFIHASKTYVRMHTDWTTIPDAHKKYVCDTYLSNIHYSQSCNQINFGSRDPINCLFLTRLTADQPERLKKLGKLAKENAKFFDKVTENDRIFENENYVRPCSCMQVP